MKLYTFKLRNYQSVAVEKAGLLFDLKALFQKHKAETGGSGAVFKNLLGLIRSGEEGLALTRKLHDLAEPAEGVSFPFGSVKILAPYRPGKILASGVNYHGHFTENPAAKVPKFPFFFSKIPSAVVGPGEPILLPKGVKQVDYEVEFAVIFGKTARKLTPETAMDAVWGYCILHDVSARDIQFVDNQITFGKNYDTFAPFGPCVVTKDSLPNPEKLALKCFVNGQALQDSGNWDWIHPLPDYVAYVTGMMTMEPGDVMTTGTPAGTGYFRDPQIFLQPGDVTACEIEGIGRLENSVKRDLRSRTMI